MKLYIFSEKADKRHYLLLQNALAEISAETDTSQLVVALYLGCSKKMTRGTAYVKNWQTPANFQTGRGYWNFSCFFKLPADLPEHYKLIRLHLDSNQRYPRVEQDIYHWKWHYNSLIDQAALLFAHELHHFRRYHLGFHPREGEHSANSWAKKRALACGFNIDGFRLKSAQPKKKLSLPNKLFDPYRKFRHLKKGDKVFIAIDQNKMYAGQTATVVRPIRSNSKRIVLETSDGKIWRWPLPWLTVLRQNKS